MCKHYYTKKEIENTFNYGSWERIIFQEFESTMISRIRPFPCIFGLAGYKLDQLRYTFNENISASNIAPALDHFAKHSKHYGKNTSLVVFSRPKSVCSIKHYKAKFWSLLQSLATLDKAPWPEDIPDTLDDPRWEFCFSGEAFFVVCNTPAHILRQSRRSSSFMMTFQPRWVFDEILGAPDAAERSIEKVRTRLIPYDVISPSPHLGLYGSRTNREYAQYFLEENNNQVKCPFNHLHDKPH